MGQSAEQHTAVDLMHPAATQGTAAQETLRSGSEDLPDASAETPGRPNRYNPFRDYLPHPAARRLVRYLRAAGLVLCALGAAGARWYSRVFPRKSTTTVRDPRTTAPSSRTRH